MATAEWARSLNDATLAEGLRRAEERVRAHATALDGHRADLAVLRREVERREQGALEARVDRRLAEMEAEDRYTGQTYI